MAVEEGSTRRDRLARSANGVVTPLYVDRHVVTAEDLTLDQTRRDAELVRLRRHLLGWGIVFGLVPVLSEGEVSVRHSDPRLVVSPGYGVTPSGAEVYLREPLVVEEIAERIRAGCGPGRGGCELPETIRPRPEGQVTGWVVARPVEQGSRAMAGVPAGCQHPAQTLTPSRSCHGVALELVCSLPSSHQTASRGCEELRTVLWGGDVLPPQLPLPVPDPRPEDDVLVIAGITVGDDLVTLDLVDRRRLLTMSMLQEWVLTCGRLVHPPVVPPPVDPPPVDPVPPIDPVDPVPPIIVRPPIDPIDPVPPIIVRPPIDPIDPVPPIIVRPPIDPIDPVPPIIVRPPIDPIDPVPPIIVRPPIDPIVPIDPVVGDTRIGTPRTPQWSDLIDALKAGGLLDAHRAGPVRLPTIISSAAAHQTLAAAGVAGPEAFLAAEPERLAGITGADQAEIEDARRALAGLTAFFRPGTP